MKAILAVVFCALSLVRYQCECGQTDKEKGEAKIIEARAGTLQYKDRLELSEGLFATGDLLRSLSQAAQKGKKVLIAFLGNSDVKSRLDLLAFSQQNIKNTLGDYIVVVFYVDDVPSKWLSKDGAPRQRIAEGEANYEFQRTNFGTGQVPLYAALSPAGKGRFVIDFQFGKALTDDADGFVARFQKKR